METHVMWTPWSGTGLEDLCLQVSDEGKQVESVVIAVGDQAPFRLWYRLLLDQNWHVRHCRFQLLGGENKVLQLSTDGRGHWNDAEGNPSSVLEGCLDVDIAVTPFTNTIPIRRLSLLPGQSADLLVAYLSVPDLQVRAMRQRYTCLETRADGGLYRYESLESDFSRDLPVDAQGLVLDYPRIWKRVEMKPLRDSFAS